MSACRRTVFASVCALVIQCFLALSAHAAMLQVEYGSTFSSGSLLNGVPLGVHGHPAGTAFLMRAVFDSTADLDPSLGSVPGGVGAFAATSLEFDLDSYGTVVATPGSMKVFFRNIGGALVDTGLIPIAVVGPEVFRAGMSVSPGVFNPDSPVTGVFASTFGGFVSPTVIPLVGGGTLTISGLSSSFSSVTITEVEVVEPPLTVPEPSSLALLSIAGLALPVWRRRSRRTPDGRVAGGVAARTAVPGEQQP